MAAQIEAPKALKDQAAGLVDHFGGLDVQAKVDDAGVLVVTFTWRGQVYRYRDDVCGDALVERATLRRQGPRPITVWQQPVADSWRVRLVRALESLGL